MGEGGSRGWKDVGRAARRGHRRPAVMRRGGECIPPAPASCSPQEPGLWAQGALRRALCCTQKLPRGRCGCTAARRLRPPTQPWTAASCPHLRGRAHRAGAGGRGGPGGHGAARRRLLVHALRSRGLHGLRGLGAASKAQRLLDLAQHALGLLLRRHRVAGDLGHGSWLVLLLLRKAVGAAGGSKV